MALDFDYFDSEKLIIQVEERPALYNKNLPEDSDKNMKEKLWIEVCEATIPNWGQLEKVERIKKGKDVQRKWKNMLDSFRKELNLQRAKKSGEGKQKRRKYIYFDQLLFLLPTIQERVTSGNYTPPEASGFEEENENGKEENDTQVMEHENQDYAAPSASTSHTSTHARHKKPIKPTLEESLLQILKDGKAEDVDEDRSFLLSLLPSFKKLSAQQKLTTKMQFLQVLNDIMFSESYQRSVFTHSVSQHAKTQIQSHIPHYFTTFNSPGMPTNIQMQLQANQKKSQQTTFPSLGLPSSGQMPQQTRPQAMNQLLQIQVDPIPSTSTQIKPNIPHIENYFSSFSPSPNPQCSVPISSALSPDVSTLLSSDSELFELH